MLVNIFLMISMNLMEKKKRIMHECSAPRTIQQNRLVERKIRTFLEMVYAMLLHAKLLFSLWGEAIFFACHIINRILSKKF